MRPGDQRIVLIGTSNLLSDSISSLLSASLESCSNHLLDGIFDGVQSPVVRKFPYVRRMRCVPAAQELYHTDKKVAEPASLLRK